MTNVTHEIEPAKALANPVNALVMCHLNDDFSTDGDINYGTDCGHMFYFSDGTPKEHEMIFCCFCGKKIRENKCDQ